MLSTPSRFRGHQVFGHLALQFDPSFFTFCHAYLAAYLIRRVFSHKKRITLVCIMPFRHSVEKDRKRILFGIEAPTFWGFTTQDVSKSSCAKYSSLEIRNWRVLLGALQPNSGRSSSTQFSCRHQPGLGNRRAKGCVELRSRNWGWRR